MKKKLVLILNLLASILLFTPIIYIYLNIYTITRVDVIISLILNILGIILTIVNIIYIIKSRNKKYIILSFLLNIFYFPYYTLKYIIKNKRYILYYILTLIINITLFIGYIYSGYKIYILRGNTRYYDNDKTYSLTLPSLGNYCDSKADICYKYKDISLVGYNYYDVLSDKIVPSYKEAYDSIIPDLEDKGTDNIKLEDINIDKYMYTDNEINLNIYFLSFNKDEKFNVIFISISDINSSINVDDMIKSIKIEEKE